MDINRHLNITLALLAFFSSLDVVAAPRQVCVGEAIQIEGRSWTAADSVTGTPVDDLADIAIAGYTIVDRIEAPITQTATLTALEFTARGTRESHSRRFHFHRPGRYIIEVRDDTADVKRHEFEVSAPNVEVTRRSVGAVYIYTGQPRPILEFSHGEANGVELDYTVSMGRCGGEVADLQILDFADLEQIEDDNNMVHDTGGDYVLDFSAGDPGRHFSFITAAAAGERVDETFQDSPNMSLSRQLVCVSSRALFRYYLMYRPSAQDAVWVPFAELAWHLDMYARRPSTDIPWVGGDGVLHSGLGRVPDAFSSDIEHWPVWSTYWRTLDWHYTDEPCEPSAAIVAQ